VRVAQSFTLALGRVLGADEPSAGVNLADDRERALTFISYDAGPLLSDQLENAAQFRVLSPLVAARFSIALFSHTLDWRILRAFASQPTAWRIDATAGFTPIDQPAYFTRASIGLSVTASNGAAPSNPLALECPFPAGLVIPGGHVATLEGGTAATPLAVQLWMGEA